MLIRTIMLGAAAAAVVGAPAIAAADPNEPPPPPPPPNVNGYAPVKPSDFAVLGDSAYAFTTPDGLTCMLQRSGGYGCSGPMPGAPEGANLVSGAMGGVPVFSNVAANPFGNIGEVKPLPANSRLSLPDAELRHRRHHHDVCRQPQPGGLRDQPRRQLDCGRGQPDGRPTRRHEPLRQLASLRSPSRAPRARASRQRGRGRRPRRLSRG